MWPSVTLYLSYVLCIPPPGCMYLCVSCDVLCVLCVCLACWPVYCFCRTGIGFYVIMLCCVLCMFHVSQCVVGHVVLLLLFMYMCDLHYVLPFASGFAGVRWPVWAFPSACAPSRVGFFFMVLVVLVTCLCNCWVQRITIHFFLGVWVWPFYLWWCLVRFWVRGFWSRVVFHPLGKRL